VFTDIWLACVIVGAEEVKHAVEIGVWGLYLCAVVLHYAECGGNESVSE
jgi:hypothetical protein